MAFQIITAGKFSIIPYSSQKKTPRAKKILKVRLISRALFSRYSLQTWGINDVVVKKPPIYLSSVKQPYYPNNYIDIPELFTVMSGNLKNIVTTSFLHNFSILYLYNKSNPEKPENI